MYFSSEFIDQLREQIKLSDVIGQKVKLRIRGKNITGLCPFHHEKSPSFNVHNDKGFFHCFGCGASGDVIEFVMKTRGIDFPDTVKALANEHGIALPETADKVESNEKQRLGRLYQVTGLAASWFSSQLNSSNGLAALKYLTNRGVGDDAIKRFNLGFAPDNRDALQKYLIANNVTKEEMLETGLIGQSNDQIYDRFSNRIIFPITNNKNHIIGFGGRIMGQHSKSPKYLNSPETILFKKGHNLYAENLVLTSTNRNKSIIIVEGYMDVIALSLVGMDNAVATLGTAITAEHLQKIWRYCKDPVVCLDGDLAGILAMERCAKLALPALEPGYSLQFVNLPEGNDPDDTIKNFGRNHLQDLLDKPISLSEAIWQTEFRKCRSHTPEQKALLQKNLMELAEQIKHQSIKQFYKKFFNDKLWQSFNPYKAKNKPVQSRQKSDSDLINVRNLSAVQRCELGLIALIIEYPILLKDNKIFNDFFMIESKIDFAPAIYQAIEESFAKVSLLEDSNTLTVEFKKIITDKMQPAQMNFLCGNSSYFIDKISAKDDNDVLHSWNESLANFNLELLRAEYKQAIQSSDENNMQRASILKDQIIQLEQQIKSKAE